MTSTPATIETIRDLICRDLAAAEREIASYPNDASLWKLPKGISNSAGNLALHLAGNLCHFIGTCLGRTDYVRDRKHEFSATNLTREDIIGEIAQASETVRTVLSSLDDSVLEQSFPNPPGTFRINTRVFLMHLCVHAGYHLGQIDYHRRLVTGDNSPIDAIALSDLQTFEAD